MWRNTYKDVREDDPNVRNQVEAGKGIVGCEMHDVHGYSLTTHESRKKPPGFLTNLVNWMKGN